MNWGRIYFGSIIVAVGVILLLDNAGTVDAGDIFGTWWPVLIITAGLLMLAASPDRSVMSLLVTAVGVALLLSTLDVVDNGDFLWPAWTAGALYLAAIILYPITNMVTSVLVVPGATEDNVVHHGRLFLWGTAGAAAVAPLRIAPPVLFRATSVQGSRCLTTPHVAQPTAAPQDPPVRPKPLVTAV